MIAKNFDENGGTRTASEPSSDSATGPGRGEASLAASLEEFLGLVKAGKRPPREEFLARHGDHAQALAECLDGLEFILSAAPQLSPGGDDAPTPGESVDP